MAKKLFYSMGEVSEMFDVNASLIRFWESKFDVLRPKKNKKGNRLFTPADIENLKLIYHLVKERGMTLEGARRCLKQNKTTISRDAELLERLQRGRAMLEAGRVELRDGAGGAEEASVCEPVTEQMRSEGTVPVIEPGPERAKPASILTALGGTRRKAKKEKTEEESKELFAFYEQSLF